ncbi:MAG TPA: hypothetical protein VFW95_06495 [Candidatus Limnocylindria bacterium]|nr:hypothetical protein [Candidatus Limnocylindria bacterium]
MSTPLPMHPRTPRGRARAGGYELLEVQRATELIEDIGSDLDRQLRLETHEPERLRLLREATNRITRTANDAIRAYAKGQRAIKAQLARTDEDAEAVLAMQRSLQGARLDLLRALRQAERRYPWAGPGAAQPTAAGRAPT